MQTEEVLYDFNGDRLGLRRRKAANPAATINPALAGSGTFVRLRPLADSKTPDWTTDCPRLCENDVKSSELTVPS